MLPAQPPHSRRMSLIWNDTDSMCVCSGRMCRAKRSGNTMIVSNASEPQISVRMGRIRTRGLRMGAKAAPRKSLAQRRVAYGECRRTPCEAAVAYVSGRLSGETLRGRAVHGLAADLADDVLLASGHRQRFVDAVQQHFPMRIAIVVRTALEAADEVARDEAVAMHANESRTELLLETRQRFLEQVLALCSTNRDVLE